MNNKLEQLKKITESRNSSSTNENISSLLALMMSKFSSDMEKIKGEQGESGYTPIKGVDYFTAEEIDSMVEYMQSKVKDGKDGEQGLPGKNGKNGLTPIRGVDYWTSSDKDSIISDIIRVIPVPKDGISPSVDEIKEKVLSELDSRPINEKVVTKDELIAFLKRGGFRGGGGSSSGSSIILQTNGVNNGSQTLLNLVQGTNITLTDDGLGGITIDATGSGLSTIENGVTTTTGFGADEILFSDGTVVRGNSKFTYNPTTNLFQVTDGTDGFLRINAGAKTFAIGDYEGAGPYIESSLSGNLLQLVATNLEMGGNQYKFPAVQGTAGQVLAVDSVSLGTATLDWVTPSSGGGITGSGVNTQITYWTGTSTIAGSAAFSWNDTTKRFVITNGGTPAKRALQVNAINFEIAMGDTATFVNGTQLLVSDTSQNVQINGSDGLGTTGSVLDIYTNLATGFGAQVFIGDVSGLVNETVLEVSDAGLRIEGRGANYRGMRLDFANDILTFGDVGQSTSGALNIGSIEIGASGQFTMYGLAADSTIAPFMAVLGPGDIYFGDLNGLGTSQTFAILESAQVYDFTGFNFQIGGLAYNFPNTQAISGQALVAQDTSGTLLYQNVQRNHFAQTQSVTVANTTTPTTITGTGEGSLLVRSNTAKVGSTYELDFEGFYNATGTVNIGYKLKILGTNIGSSITNTIPPGGSAWDVRGHFKLTVLTTGASGTASLNGYITYDKNDGTSVTYPLNQTAFQAIDTTINQTTDFVATWSAADPLNSLTIRQLTFNQTR